MKRIILLIILLIIPLVSAEPLIGGFCWFSDIQDENGYYLTEDCLDIEYYGLNESEVYGNWNSELGIYKNAINNRCLDIILSSSLTSTIAQSAKKIRVWDLNPKEGLPAGVYFLSNIIHIYNGCRNPDTLIHELAHLDRQSIKHDEFFWLSYYRIKGEI